MPREFLQWQAPEYEYAPRGTDWYWTVGIIGAALVAVAIIIGNVLFAVFLVVGTVALLLQSARRPRVMSFAIDQRGVHIATTLYPFSSLESFFITSEEESPHLLLKSSRFFTPLISIPLAGVDADVVHEFLEEYLPEEELHEPLSQRIMERLGF